MTRPVVVLPDLHGRADLLEAAILHRPDAHFLCLGDAIDRGPRSLDAVRILMDLHAQGRATLLMGNHERMMQEGVKHYRTYLASHDMGDYRRAMEGFQWWMRAGGETVRREMPALTLEQFPPVLEDYLPLLRRVVYVTADGGIHDELPAGPSVMVAHASPPVPHRQYPNPLSAALWLRPFEGPFPLPDGVLYSVHGHTPVPMPQKLGRHLYVDLGAYETGHLALVDLNPHGSLEAGPKILVLEGRGRPEMRGKYSRFGEPVPAQLTRLERLGQRS
ncbi:metallophosphoesterase [Deinococcus ficus]|uniref:Phosphoprotein phosphatase n=1 Tax=Deinococcus ficus TaxID=317577 RepID=A0A221SY42_9DEIO|nr:metallophosphoesterase [Deinococcus ficus]ASN81565.1 phosphoprotein phosphatase [Deinococcus ficus]